MPLVAPTQLDPLRMALNRLSAASAATFGVPGFYVPRIPPPFIAPDGTTEALSVYDTSPLRETLQRLVDFDLINGDRSVRLSLGAVNVRTGRSVYFDSHDQTLEPEHVMASGSLPPGFPPTAIEGVHYWDGGLVSNSPLSYVFDAAPRINALIVQVDLFSAAGELPINLDQVLERAKDIQYSSKTRFNTAQIQELEGLRHAVGRLLRKLPATLHDDPEYRLLQPLAELRRHITIVHFVNRRLSSSTHAKDFEFSRATVRELWEAGLEDVRRTVSHRSWLKARELVEGVRVFDLAA
jgi:NTE family protein